MSEMGPDHRKYTAEQREYILRRKLQGKTPKIITEECRQRWPERSWSSINISSISRKWKLDLLVKNALAKPDMGRASETAPEKALETIKPEFSSRFQIPRMGNGIAEYIGYKSQEESTPRVDMPDIESPFSLSRSTMSDIEEGPELHEGVAENPKPSASSDVDTPATEIPFPAGGSNSLEIADSPTVPRMAATPEIAQTTDFVMQDDDSPLPAVKVTDSVKSLAHASQDLTCSIETTNSSNIDIALINDCIGFEQVLFDVGTPPQRFSAHKKLLREKSTFFNSMLLQDHEIFVILDHSPEIFMKLLEYIYTGSVQLIPKDSIASQANKGQAQLAISTAMSLYFLALEVEMPNLADAAMTQLIEICLKWGTRPGREDIKTFYSKIYPRGQGESEIEVSKGNNGLRLFISKCYTWLHLATDDKHTTGIDDTEKIIPDSGLRELLLTYPLLLEDFIRLSRNVLRGGRGGNILDPRQEPLCSYHQHNPDSECMAPMKT